MKLSSSDPPGVSGPLIVYDGECRFCRAQVSRIRKHDRAGQFRYAPFQSEEIRRRFAEVSEPEWGRGVRLFDAEGKGAVGAEAIYEIYQRIPPFDRLAWVYRIPGLGGLFRLAYWLIARNRHRLARLARRDDGGP